MSKSAVNQTSTHPLAKKQGRSKGPLVKDPVLNDMVTSKVFEGRKRNNPERYKEVATA